ncbi:MAG TPA: hypothetical protein VFZ40_06310 [Pyrinomonadaceae bacterium]
MNTILISTTGRVLSCIAFAASLILSGVHTQIAAQELTPTQRTQLCKEKKSGLARLEQEAVDLRSTISRYEESLEALPKLSQEQIDERLAFAVRQVEGLKRDLENSGIAPEARKTIEKRLAVYRAAMDLYAAMKTENIGSDPDIQNSTWVRRVKAAISSAQERQTEVGRQIFLLRDSIESLRCAELEGFAGTWLFRGYPNAVCTIELTGDNRLKAVTEKGVVGYGYFVDQKTIVVDFPFARGLRGWLTEDGSRISWGNREFWVRVQ